jgi:putative endonuclease
MIYRIPPPFKKAEIDIITKKKIPWIVSKTCSSLEFGLPQDFVKPKKFNFS